MPRVLARDCQCPPTTTSSSATRSNTIKSATPPTPPVDDHLHYQSMTTYTALQPAILPTPPADDKLHLQSRLPNHPQARNTARRQPPVLPMATTGDFGLEVGLTVTQDTEPGPGPNALFLAQHIATYTDFKAAMCRWTVAAHFETRYEKLEKIGRAHV